MYLNWETTLPKFQQMDIIPAEDTESAYSALSLIDTTYILRSKYISGSKTQREWTLHIPQFCRQTKLEKYDSTHLFAAMNCDANYYARILVDATSGALVSH